MKCLLAIGVAGVLTTTLLPQWIPDAQAAQMTRNAPFQPSGGMGFSAGQRRQGLLLPAVQKVRFINTNNGGGSGGGSKPKPRPSGDCMACAD